MNTNPQTHWNHDDLLDRLYGLDPRPGLDPAHFEVCAECRGSWTVLTQRREEFIGEVASSTDVPAERWRAQRTAVMTRVEKPWASPFWRIVPAGALAMMLVAGVLLHQPAPAPVETAQNHQVVAVSDAELFSEAATMADLDGSRTTQTIQALFDSNSEVEVQ
jgi:hypothetical protein